MARGKNKGSFVSKPLSQRLADNTRREGECLLWTGEVNNKGYGRIRTVEGKNFLPHRVAYTLAYGPIPEGMFVCHKCDTPRCCEPSHLWLGTNTDNVQDMTRKGRSGLAKLTPVQVQQLRVLFAAGYSVNDVIPYYPKVTHRTFRRIKAGTAWRSL